jgi:hypothetical protein
MCFKESARESTTVENANDGVTVKLAGAGKSVGGAVGCNQTA